MDVKTSERVTILDHGYVELIESWGSDEAIIEAARMSTAKGFLGWGPYCVECGFTKGDDHEVGCSQPDQYKPGDEKLLAYLWNNKHSTPFEFAGMTIEVQAPIFVFREWHRHRTQSFAERSARYTPLPDFNYVPSVERCLRGGGRLTKQAAAKDGASELSAANAEIFTEKLSRFYEQAESFYQESLSHGIPKELARLCLPIGRYTAMRASTDLRNWLGFLALRLPATAQWEIRMYAEAVHDMLCRRFPRTLELFDKGLAISSTRGA